MLRQVKKKTFDIFLKFRSATRTKLVLPDFMIIGIMKGGTTSFYENLTQHPQIYPALYKEIHYFNRHLLNLISDTRDINWYSAHFPPRRVLDQRNGITGEATPNYINHWNIVPQIAEILPDVKIIILLRDPVKQAYSHYQHHQRSRSINRDELFMTYIEHELEFYKEVGVSNALFDDQTLNELKQNSKVKGRITRYAVYGLYIFQIKRWHEFFDKSQFLIMKSEDYFKHPETHLEEAANFLGVNPHSFDFKREDKQSGHSYEPISQEAKAALEEFFAPYNQQLYDYLDRDFGW